MTNYIFVTGGVVSSLGKGIISASLGRLLKNRGLKVAIQKFDPYLNIDPGTMNPYQHGEVYVTEDGTETDLDLGHYERFINNNLNKYSNFTSGKIYKEILQKERHGDYLGGTVQVIPHVTDTIKEKIFQVGKTTQADVVITEIGGTVGDIESVPFLEAIRQMKGEVGSDHTFYIHTTLVPYLKSAKEMKTKPTQHSIKELQGLGIQPNMLVLRSEKPVTKEMKEKIALFGDVKVNNIIESPDVNNLYELPLNFQKQKMDDEILDHFNVKVPKANMKKWTEMVNHINSLTKEVTIALVGKYAGLKDAYLSVLEALNHAGYASNVKVNLKTVDAEKITEANVADKLKGMDGVIIPGGFGKRGIEGLITTIKYVRTHDIPFFGICLGLQLASIEYARDVLGYHDANSTEFDTNTKHKVIDLMASQSHLSSVGGTQRLGAYECVIEPNTKAAQAYKKPKILERHRHRYEFNNNYKKEMENHGMVFSGTSPDKKLVEILELPSKKFFVATQYHPEFVSRPQHPEGLFKSFVNSVVKSSNK